MEKRGTHRLSVNVSDRLQAEIDRIAESPGPSKSDVMRAALEERSRQEWLESPEPIAIVERDGSLTLNRAAQKAQDDAKWMETLNSAFSEMDELTANLAHAENRLELYREVFSDIEATRAAEIEGLDQIDRNRREFSRLISKLFPSVSLGVLSVDLNALRKLIRLVYVN